MERYAYQEVGKTTLAAESRPLYTCWITGKQSRRNSRVPIALAMQGGNKVAITVAIAR